MAERFSILERRARREARFTPEERALRRERRRRQTLQVLPSLFTMGNAFCGFAAIVHVAAIQIDPATLTMQSPENLARAGWLLLLAMLFDALDGRIARMTKTTGDFGGQLDSLCDAVSFGVAPAVIVVMTNSRILAGAIGHPLWWRFAWLAGLVYVSGAILRLARFNVENQSHEESAHTHFKGLPSPAAAGVVASLAILQGYLRSTQDLWFLAPETLRAIADGITYAFPVVALATGLLMVSNVRYVHFGNRVLRGRRTMRGLAKIVIPGILLFALVPQIGIALAFFGFAFSGVALHLVEAGKAGKQPAGEGEAGASGDPARAGSSGARRAADAALGADDDGDAGDEDDDAEEADAADGASGEGAGEARSA